MDVLQPPQLLLLVPSPHLDLKLRHRQASRLRPASGSAADEEVAASPSPLVQHVAIFRRHHRMLRTPAA
eukprot:765142-Hanusia_phi.AAC.2